MCINEIRMKLIKEIFFSFIYCRELHKRIMYEIIEELEHLIDTFLA